MFWELFPEIRFPADLALFKKLSALRHPAYKYELARGIAELTPEPQSGRAVLHLPNWSRPQPRWDALQKRGLRIRPLAAADWPALPRLLRAAHAFELPFAALDDAGAARAATACIAYLRRGGEGELVKGACCVATEDTSRRRLMGAIFVTLIDRHSFFWESNDPDIELAKRAAPIAHLTWMMVRAGEHRRGIGSALLARAVTALRKLGHTTLASTFLIGNVRAMLWHWRTGFGLI